MANQEEGLNGCATCYSGQRKPVIQRLLEGVRAGRRNLLHFTEGVQGIQRLPPGARPSLVEQFRDPRTQARVVGEAVGNLGAGVLDLFEAAAAGIGRREY